MSNNSNGTILISTIGADAEPQGEHMFQYFARVTAKTQKVLTEELRKNFAEITNELKLLVESLPDTMGEYSIDTITFSLCVNGNGKISLVGELSRGLSSSIALTLKK